MKKIKKWHYAVVRSVFGDYWVGKTMLPLIKEKIFVDVEDAIQKAEELFLDSHMDFDPDLDENDENYNDSIAYEFEKLSDVTETEEISKEIEKYIVD